VGVEVSPQFLGLLLVVSAVTRSEAMLSLSAHEVHLVVLEIELG